MSNSSGLPVQKQLETGLAHHRMGRLEEAATCYRSILEQVPRHAEALQLLGATATQRGDHAEAVRLIQAAIEVNPEVALYHANLALVYNALGLWEDALSCCEAALGLDATDAELYGIKGMVQCHLGRPEAALATLDRALELRPDDAALHNSRGNALRLNGRSSDAAAAYETALQYRPDYPEALNNRAVLFLAEGQAPQAEAMLERAVRIKPRFPEALNHLGMVCQLQSKMSEADRAYQAALSLEPDQPLWQIRRAVACPVISTGDRATSRWRRRFAKILADLPRVDLARHMSSLATSHAEPPYHLAYQGEDNLALKRDFATLYRCSYPPAEKIGSGGIAFLVTGGHEGIFLNCNLGLLQQWQGSLPLTLIGTVEGLNRIRPLLQGTDINLLSLSADFADNVERIRAAAFDLIYYWEVGSDAVNYFLPFFRLAPVQCTSWGTPETSGHPGIDYYLSCLAWEDESATSRYTEQHLLLNRIPMHFLPPSPPKRSTSGWKESGLQGNIYFCAQNIMKLHPDFDLLLGEILKRDDRASVVLVEGKQEWWTHLLKQRLSRQPGVQSERITFLNRLDYTTYLQLVHQADVVLDSLHFSGGATSYEALSLGVPVITLPGDFSRGRFTSGCYQQMGITTPVARDREDYIELALRMARDREFRQHAREQVAAARDRLVEDRDAAWEFEQTLTRLANSGL